MNSISISDRFCAVHKHNYPYGSSVAFKMRHDLRLTFRLKPWKMCLSVDVTVRKNIVKTFKQHSWASDNLKV